MGEQERVEIEKSRNWKWGGEEKERKGRNKGGEEEDRKGRSEEGKKVGREERKEGREGGQSKDKERCSGRIRDRGTKETSFSGRCVPRG